VADFTIVDQDEIVWMTTFGTCVTASPPRGSVVASAKKAEVIGRPPALVGDEARWESAPVAYIDGDFVTPGAGVARVTRLADDQKTTVVECEGRAVVIRGTLFEAEFHVTSPATKPTPGGPVPDPVAVKTNGQGRLVNRNKTVKMI